MEMALLLAPLILIITWGGFMLSGDLVVSLVALLLTSLVLPFVYMENLKLFWPCGLLLILMSTGLIVIFAYIVSLHLKEKNIWRGSWLIYFFMTGSALLSLCISSSYMKIVFSYWKVYVNPSLSFSLFFLLLYLVVSFIRMVYSKGGGFRKKF
uniref:NADH dehydrogenase subunit 6 n=1 Tax=Myrsidea sp. ADS-2020 TaxID=2794901 RepID=A0A7T1M842_9NEOP|nr:NADH dehydrogenase subunit 6 [Myrsidea sp. ADS-2020]